MSAGLVPAHELSEEASDVDMSLLALRVAVRDRKNGSSFSAEPTRATLVPSHELADRPADVVDLSGLARAVASRPRSRSPSPSPSAAGSPTRVTMDSGGRRSPPRLTLDAGGGGAGAHTGSDTGSDTGGDSPETKTNTKTNTKRPQPGQIHSSGSLRNMWRKPVRKRREELRQTTFMGSTDANALQLLRSVLAMGSPDGALSDESLAMMQRLEAFPKARNAVGRQLGPADVRLLLSCIRLHGNNADIVFFGWRVISDVLASVNRGDDDGSQQRRKQALERVLGACDAVQVLTASLERFGGNVMLVKLCAAALVELVQWYSAGGVAALERFLAAKRRVNAQSAPGHSTLSELLTLMLRHGRQRPVQESGCRVLKRLCAAGGEDVELRIARAEVRVQAVPDPVPWGGVRVLIGVLLCFSELEKDEADNLVIASEARRIRVLACSILLRMCAHHRCVAERVQRMHGAAALGKTLQEHPDSNELREFAARATAQIALTAVRGDAAGLQAKTVHSKIRRLQQRRLRKKEQQEQLAAQRAQRRRRASMRMSASPTAALAAAAATADPLSATAPAAFSEPAPAPSPLARMSSSQRLLSATSPSGSGAGASGGQLSDAQQLKLLRQKAKARQEMLRAQTQARAQALAEQIGGTRKDARRDTGGADASARAWARSLRQLLPPDELKPRVMTNSTKPGAPPRVTGTKPATKHVLFSFSQAEEEAPPKPAKVVDFFAFENYAYEGGGSPAPPSVDRIPGYLPRASREADPQAGFGPRFFRELPQTPGLPAVCLPPSMSWYGASPIRARGRGSSRGGSSPGRPTTAPA